MFYIKPVERAGEVTLPTKELAKEFSKEMKINKDLIKEVIENGGMYRNYTLEFTSFTLLLEHTHCEHLPHIKHFIYTGYDVVDGEFVRYEGGETYILSKDGVVHSVEDMQYTSLDEAKSIAAERSTMNRNELEEIKLKQLKEDRSAKRMSFDKYVVPEFMWENIVRKKIRNRICWLVEIMKDYGSKKMKIVITENDHKLFYQLVENWQETRESQELEIYGFWKKKKRYVTVTKMVDRSSITWKEVDIKDYFGL